ncbi:hypothetical protein GCM10027341_01120 [Spirosoma knui]
MNRVITCLLLLWPMVGLSQTDRSVLIGIDATKLVLTATNGWPLFRQATLLEPTIKIPLSTNTLTLQPGYASLTTRTVLRNMNQAYEGFYLKVGLDRINKKNVLIGWQGIISVYQQGGSFTFPGATYGDYTRSLPTQTKAVVGIEPHIGGITRLSDRFELHTTARLGAGLTIGYNASAPPSMYVPGFGSSTGRTISISLGFGVQLYYRTQRSAPN